MTTSWHSEGNVWITRPSANIEVFSPNANTTTRRPSIHETRLSKSYQGCVISYFYFLQLEPGITLQLPFQVSTLSSWPIWFDQTSRPDPTPSSTPWGCSDPRFLLWWCACPDIYASCSKNRPYMRYKTERTQLACLFQMPVNQDKNKVTNVTYW